MTQFSAMQTSTTDVSVYFLLVMSVLIAVVGGLGLMVTMCINVLDKKREIGVMRAMGATDRGILQLVVVEGILIGAVSWISGPLLSVPVAILMMTVVGVSLLAEPMTPVYSVIGIVFWLVGMLVIAAVSSAVPAYNASHLKMRKVWAYE